MAKPKHDELVGTVEHHAEAGHDDVNLIAPDVQMVIFTWITFFLLLAVLYKAAWKPILAGLDQREADIQKSIEDADKIKEEMENLAQNQARMLQEAENKAMHIIEESRHAASEAAKSIQDKAKEEAQIILENARRDIHEEAERIQANLREESATIAVELARKILEENLDAKKNQKIIDGYIQEL